MKITESQFTTFQITNHMAGRSFFGKMILYLIVFCALIPSQDKFLCADETLPAKPKTAEEKEDEETEAITEELPKLETLSLPTVNELLQQEKQDWIVLTSGRVLKVPAFHPRPDHLAWLIQQQKKLAAIRPHDDDLLPAWSEKYKQYNYITIAFSDQGIEEDYRLHVRYVDYVLHHEDLALRKVDQLIKAGNSTDAQRLISAVTRWSFRNNIRRKKEGLAVISWSGLLDRNRALLLLNVKQSQEKSRWERAFNLSKMYWEIDPAFDQLPWMLGKAFDQIAKQAVQGRDYRKVRFFLRQLHVMYPTHEKIEDWKNQLIRLSEEKTRLAKASYAAKDYRKASRWAQQAINIWSYNSQSRRALQKFQQRHQLLRVGQIENDSQIDFHQRCLLDHQWFHVEKIAEGYPRYRSLFVESWEPDDLGRSIKLKLKLAKQSHESRPTIESSQLANQLTAATLQCLPENRGLNSHSIRSVQSLSPDQLKVEIVSQAAHPLGLFAGLLNSEFSHQKNFLKQSHFRPLLPSESADTQPRVSQFIRTYPQSDRDTRFGIAEIQEQLFPRKEELLRALLRDQIDYIPNFPVAYIKQLKRDQRFIVLKYHTPQLHLIQFNFHGFFAQQPELRLALFAALNRKEMRTHIAKTEGASSTAYQLTNSLTPSTSHAENQSQQVVKFDRIAAHALFAILSRGKKSFPEIKLLVTKDNESQQLARLIKSQWEPIGIKVKYVTAEMIKKQEAKWDVAIVAHRMLAPEHDLPRLFSSQNRLTETELQHLPVTIQRSLLSLEQSRNWKEIDNTLRELQDRLCVNAWMLPLWEKECYQVIRREVRNLPTNAVRPYQQLDHWTIEPIIPTY